MKRRLLYLIFILALFTPIAASMIKPQQAAAATTAENKASAAAQKYCDNISPGGAAHTPCLNRYKEFYLGDNPSTNDCPGSDTDYQWCNDAARYAKQQAGKDFPDFDKLCSTFISNASGGSWPDFSKLGGSQKQKAIDACNKGLSEGYTYAPGAYPANEVCGTQYKDDNTLLKACNAGESLADAHIFTPAEVKAIAKSGNLSQTNNGGDPAGGADPTAGGDPTPDCESKGDKLGWAFCAMYEDVATGAQWFLDHVIQPMLQTDPICTDSSGCNQKGNATYEVWSRFRVYGDIFLVIALLVIVFGESIGGGMIDAYTAKKILPRLLIAAILINLSIYIVAALVDITNVIGGSIGQLITAPLHGSQVFTISPSGVQVGVVSGFTLFGGLTAVFVLGAAGIVLLLLGLVISGAIALLGIFITLIIREAIISALVFVAPIAFALWCLPNTERWFKRWWDMLFQMLLVYPMIVVIFAVADIMSALTASGDKSDPLNTMVSFLLLIIPLYLIPLTLRSSNQVLGQIHGAVSNIGKRINSGTGQRVMQFGTARAGKLHEKRMTGESWFGTGRTGNLYRRTAAGGENGSWGLSRRSRQRWHQQEEKHFDDQAAKMLEEGGERAFNDDDVAALAVQTGMTRNRAIDELERSGRSREDATSAVLRAEQATGTRMGSDQMAVAAQKFRIAGTNTAYDAGPAGLEQMRTEVQDMVGRGLITTHDAAGWMKANRGRADYSKNSFGSTVEFLQGAQTADQQIAGAFNGAEPRDIMGSHQRAVEGFADHAQDHLSHALASGNQEVIDNAMADVANIHSMLSSTSPEKAVEFADTVLAQPSGMTGQRPALDATGAPVMDPVLDATGAPTMRRTGRVDAAGADIMEPAMQQRMENYDMTVRQYIDTVRSDQRNHPTFHNRSREYTSARDAAAAGGAAAAAAPPPAGGAGP